MRLILKSLLVCCILWMPVQHATAAADAQRIQLAQGGGKSLNQAVEQVRRQYKDGRIISAETKMNGNQEVHHIRVMVDGKVKTVRVNGRKRG